MQPIQREQCNERTNLDELQSTLDDYLGDRLSFDELRTRWITGLADNPDMRGGALRLLYKQPLSEHLAEEKILSLKRIVETAIDDDPEDWTIDLRQTIRRLPPSPLRLQRIAPSHPAD